jgi:sec-independent protein translocase protein TatC
MSDPGAETQQMSFWGHLQELRVRLVRCALYFAGGFCATYAFRLRIWEWVNRPLMETYRMQWEGLGRPMTEALDPFSFTSVTEPFFSLLRVSFWAAGFLVSPLIFYQVWAFIRPGLYKRERKMVIPFVLVTTLCFLTGAAFAYVFAFQSIAGIMLEEAFKAGLRPNLKLDEYLDLFITTIVGTGLTFEMPVLVYFLAKFRLVTAKWMLKYWRHAAIAILVVASFITPDDILVTTMFIAAMMLALYFISVLVAKLAEPKKERVEEDRG